MLKSLFIEKGVYIPNFVYSFGDFKLPEIDA